MENIMCFIAKATLCVPTLQGRWYAHKSTRGWWAPGFWNDGLSDHSRPPNTQKRPYRPKAAQKCLNPISNFNLKYEYPNFLFIQSAHQFNTFLPTKNLHFNSLIFNRWNQHILSLLKKIEIMVGNCGAKYVILTSLRYKPVKRVKSPHQPPHKCHVSRESSPPN